MGKETEIGFIKRLKKDNSVNKALKTDIYHWRQSLPGKLSINPRIRLLEISVCGSCRLTSRYVRKEIPFEMTYQFTEKQGQYLSYIFYYTKINFKPPAEADMQKYFQVSPPSVHQMILKLEQNGLVERAPKQSRNIKVLVPPEKLPRLK